MREFLITGFALLGAAVVSVALAWLLFLLLLGILDFALQTGRIIREWAARKREAKRTIAAGGPMAQFNQHGDVAREARRRRLSGNEGSDALPR